MASGIQQTKPRIRFRADGGKIIGLGHIFRMIALYDLLDSDFECSFLIINLEDEVIRILIKNDCKILSLESCDLDGPGTNDGLDDPISRNDILILDGYHFDTAYQTAVKKAIGCKLVCIDDIIAFSFVADVVINHAGGVGAKEYEILPESILLLGPAYAILRRQFYIINSGTSRKDKTKKVFINFGGADPQNFTSKVLKKLLALSSSLEEVNVVIGDAYLYSDELSTIVEKYPFIKVFKGISADEIFRLMKESGSAICSASTVSYEYCSVTGLLFILATASNQLRLYDFLIQEKLAYPYEDFENIIMNSDSDQIQDNLCRVQKKHFDGLAGKRLRKEINRLYLKNNFSIRRAVAEDVDTYFKWGNDQEVRKNSFNSNPIPYDEHCKWFHSNLMSPEACMYIFTTGENIPLASIRFKICNTDAILSYLVDERFRGIGFGKVVIEMGTKTFFQENPGVSTVTGFVKVNNLPSIMAFKASNFRETGSSEEDVKSFSKANTNE